MKKLPTTAEEARAYLALAKKHKHRLRSYEQARVNYLLAHERPLDLRPRLRKRDGLSS